MANKFKFEKGTEVIVTMVDGTKVDGTIIKGGTMYDETLCYEVRFNETYVRTDVNGYVERFDTMNFIPEHAIEKRR